MRYLSVLLLLVLASCSSNEREVAILKTDSLTASSRPAGDARPAVPDFYHKYTGLIAGRPVVAHLVMRSGNLSGTYYYESIGIPIKLWGSGYDATTQRYELSEAAGESQIWKVAIRPGRLQGRWVSASQAFDIDLAEAQGADLVTWTRMDSIRARSTSPEPHATVGVEFLLPRMNSLPLEKAIIEMFPAPGHVFAEEEEPPHAKDIAEFWERMRDQFFNFYREVTTEESDSSIKDGRFDFTVERSSDVYFDRNDFLVLGFQSYEYSGGAHGNGGTEFINYDLRTAKVWTLEDMIKVDSAKIIALLEKEAHVRYDIPENVPLVPNLLTYNLYIPVNYLVTHKGITFSYWPYAIASYVQGEIQLFIPWTDLRDLIKPAFAQRMQL